MSTVTAAPYTPAFGCDARLNEWCDTHCPHAAEHGPLLARFDTSHIRSPPQWRCYARSTLTDDGMQYRSGNTFCTRHAQLSDLLERCRAGSVPTATVGADGTVRGIDSPPSLSPSPPRQQQRMPAAAVDREPCCRVPRHRNLRAGRDEPVPRYMHAPSNLELPAAVPIPRLVDCEADLLKSATFWAISMHTPSYDAKAERLRASCEQVGVCCGISRVPDGAFDGLREGDPQLRYRLIASKPNFILKVLRESRLPVAWLDADLEFHSYPSLFAPAAWSQYGTRDVILWNWQANVSSFSGRRLKMASGVAWFNTTKEALDLLTAWTHVMAFEPNARVPDDQAMDLLVNDGRLQAGGGDGWIDRAAFGWLPESYLRMMPRHRHITPVIDHDRGNPVSGPGRNSPHKPTLPPPLVLEDGSDRLLADPEIKDAIKEAIGGLGRGGNRVAVL